MSLLLTLAVFSAAPVAIAQADDDAPWAARSGDAWVDDALADMNHYAARHRDAFIDELVRYQSAPRVLVEESMSAGAVPGDVYFACAIAQALGRPCRELLEAAARDPDAGWGGLVRGLDAQHAATALNRVKRGIVDSYDRWGRPVSLDAALKRAFPGR